MFSAKDFTDLVGDGERSARVRASLFSSRLAGLLRLSAVRSPRQSALSSASATPFLESSSFSRPFTKMSCNILCPFSLRNSSLTTLYATASLSSSGLIGGFTTCANASTCAMASSCSCLSDDVCRDEAADAYCDWLREPGSDMATGFFGCGV